MRWQRLQLADGPDSPAALFGTDAFADTIDSPEFAGLTFYVVHAKTIINRVPAGSRVPFSYTVNPYRGCSHACVYCLSGETPILMANGRTRPLSEVTVGDEIVGTLQEGRHRRYAVTEVLDHWQTVKPAFRVTLADGTELITSGDHRFLSDRGWKYVTGSDHGGGRRPHLTTDDTLRGTGRFADPPKRTSDYRRGYLRGLLRDDADSGTGEALARANEYRGGIAVETAKSWPSAPSPDWRKGFLAGMFDAKGHGDGGAVRIADSDPETRHHIATALTAFGFDYLSDMDDSLGSTPVRTIRIRGGLRETLRFFHTVDPATNRELNIAGAALEAVDPLGVRSIESLGIEMPMFDITTGTGDFIADGVVSHNCFARKTHEYLNLGTGADFDSKVIVKANAGRLLRKELAHPSWSGETIAMGTNVDCYQRAEGRYRLMPGIIAALRDAANPFSILTKGTLILRDLELLRRAAAVTRVSTAVSVSLDNLPLWRSVEPGTPRPGARLSVCEKLNTAGIDCSVLLAPILPFLTDSPEQLRGLVAKCAAAGATGVTPIVLHLRSGAREWFLKWLWREYPGLVADYQLLYSGGSYADKEYQRHITELVGDLADEYGIPRRERPRPSPPAPVAEPPEPPQPTLF